MHSAHATITPPHVDRSPVGHQPKPTPSLAAETSPSTSAVAESATAVTDQPWNQKTVDQAWQSSLAGIDPMTETLARSVSRVQVAGDSTLRLVFPASAKMAMSRCDLPEHKNAIAEAVSRWAGRTVTLELVRDETIPSPVIQEKKDNRLSGKERMERMRQIEMHPLVQSCIEQFEAEIVKIDDPR